MKPTAWFQRWFAVVLLPLATASGATDVVVLTTFSKDVTDTYRKAFEAHHPGDKVLIVNKSTTELLSYLKNPKADAKPDVVWASDPGAFVALAQAQLLQAAPSVRNTGIPRRIGNVEMDGPNDLYFGQALSGYGLMFNEVYLRARGLLIPRGWSDVAQAAFWGHVVMSSPSKSGTTHLTAEVILQSQGWTQGWGTLTQIAGNSTRITPRSFDVPADVNKSKVGVGLVVDFFGLAGRASGHPVSFVYPQDTVVLPASIALAAAAKDRAASERFMRFTLSNEGQSLMFEPQISRMPASPFAAASMKVPSAFPNVYAVARKTPLEFSLPLYEQRRELVARLFDAVILRPHDSLRGCVRLMHQLEQAQRGSGLPAESQALLQQARARLAEPWVSANDSADPQFLAQLQIRFTAAPGAELSPQEQQWTEQAQARYAQVTAWATDALKKAGRTPVVMSVNK